MEHIDRLEAKIDKLGGDLNTHMKEESKLQLETAKSLTGLLYTVIGHTVVGLGFIGVFSWHYITQQAIDSRQEQNIAELQTKVEVLDSRITTLEAVEKFNKVFP